MKLRTIILYSSVHGQTKKICEFISSSLMKNGEDVEMIHINDLIFTIDEIFHFDKIIIASSIRYGKHNEQIEKFIQNNFELLNAKKTGFVSVNLVARKLEKSASDTNPYVIKFLNAITWKPTLTAVFAGTLNYGMYNFSDRILIKLIMLITKGPTNSKTKIEYTNWSEVEKFVEKFNKL
jgi:menaquinone-dependent protoporphyrinogen oxidase